MSEVKSSGWILKDINNRTYARYETGLGEEISQALECGSIPYFARFNDKELSLTYDSDYSEQVDEIIRKSSSGEFQQIIRDIKNRKNGSSYLVLIPEVAEILEMSVSTLKSRPEEIQETLCRTYVDMWYCDSFTIRKRLSELLMTEVHEEELKKKQNVITR